MLGFLLQQHNTIKGVGAERAVAFGFPAPAHKILTLPVSAMGVMLFIFITDINSGAECTFDDTKLCGAVDLSEGWDATGDG